MNHFRIISIAIRQSLECLIIQLEDTVQRNPTPETYLELRNSLHGVLDNEVVFFKKDKKDRIIHFRRLARNCVFILKIYRFFHNVSCVLFYSYLYDFKLKKISFQIGAEIFSIFT